MSIINEIPPLVAAGVALHFLHPRSKRPIAEGWSTAPVATFDELQAAYRPGFNLGVRLGEPSAVIGGFLHCLDVDIRDPDQAYSAWAALRDLLPVDPKTLPSVVSGSGGESRHLYFISDKPLRSKKLWSAGGKQRGPDRKWHAVAEIELFGTGKQTVLPSSIHPVTGRPYIWERPLDFAAARAGLPIATVIAAEALAVIVEPAEASYAFEKVEPLSFKAGQLESELAEIAISDLDYDDWIRIGQALHHQFGGSQVGFDLWLMHTRRSTKFEGERQVRDMRRSKWPSFGRYRGRPVTMATIRQWVINARRERVLAEFGEIEDAFGDDA